MASRSSPDVRRASLLLSGLVLTGDDSLEAFRDRRVGDASVDIAHLRRARDILDAIHEAIGAGDDERWARIERAHAVLFEEEGQADSGSPASDQAEEAPEPPSVGAPSPSAGDAPPASMQTPAPVAAPAPAAPASPAPPKVGGVAETSPWADGRGASPPKPAPQSPGPAPAPPSPAPAPPSPASPSPASPSPASPSPASPSPASPRPAKEPPPAPRPVSPPPASTQQPAPASGAPGPVVPAGINPKQVADVKVAVSDTTLPIDSRRDEGRTVLPFVGSVNEPPPSAVGDVAEPVDALNQTAMGDIRSPGVTLPFKMPPGVKPPAPEAPPLPSHLSGLNIEHYAALCAERDVYKGWERQVEARYGINSDADREAVDAHFRAQMKSDPDQMVAWRKRYATVEAWAREQRGQRG